jgi:hypothetical protein
MEWINATLGIGAERLDLTRNPPGSIGNNILNSG